MFGDYGIPDQDGMGSYSLSGTLVGNYEGTVPFTDSEKSLSIRLKIYDFLIKYHKSRSIKDEYILEKKNIFNDKKKNIVYSLTDLGFETYKVMFETGLSKKYIEKENCENNNIQ